MISAKLLRKIPSTQGILLLLNKILLLFSLKVYHTVSLYYNMSFSRHRSCHINLFPKTLV